MKKKDHDLDEIREKTKETEKNLKEKRKARKEKRESVSLNERLVAPTLLIITLLISYLITLFS